VPEYLPSLNQRKQKFLNALQEEGCCGGGMSVGGDGFEGSADAEGPMAGYDPLMRTLRRLKKKKSK